MTLFKEMVDTIEFTEDLIPAIVITLEDSLLERYKKEKKDSKAKREKKKVWAEFNSRLKKENLKKSYEIVEGLTLSSFKGVDNEDTIVGSGEDYVVILEHSIPYVSGLPAKFRSSLKCGVRWLSKDGQIFLVPDDGGEFLSSQIDIETDWTSSLEQLEVAKEGLDKLEETLIKERELEEREKAKRKKEEKVERNKNNEPQKISAVTSSTKEEDKELKSRKSKHTSVSDDSFEAARAGETKKVEVKLNDRNSDSDVSIENNSSSSEAIVMKKLNDMLPEVQLERISNVIDENRIGKVDYQINPLANVTKEKVNSRIDAANKELAAKRQLLFTQLKSRAEILLQRELERIQKETDLSSDSEFSNALMKYELAYKEKTKEVEAAITKKNEAFDAEYDRNRDNFVEEQIKILGVKYDTEHKKTLDQKKREYKEKVINELNEQYVQGIEKIKKQAALEAEKAKKAIAPRILSLMEDELADINEQYRAALSGVIETTKAENAKELQKLNQDLKKILNNLSTQEGTELEKAETYIDDLKKQRDEAQNQKAEMQLEKIKLEKVVETKDVQLSELQSSQEQLSKEVRALRDQLTVVYKSKTDLEVTQLSHANERIPGSLEHVEKRRLSERAVLGIVGLVCITIFATAIGIVLLRPINSQQADPTIAQATTQSFSQESSTVISREDSAKISESTFGNSEVYSAQSSNNTVPSAKKKPAVGDEVSIRNGEQVMAAAVVEVNSETALVRTADGQEYTINVPE